MGVAVLSPKQLQDLRAISAILVATQRELADRLGVTAPTVNNRENSIPGVDWAERREFVGAVFETDADGAGQELGQGSRLGFGHHAAGNRGRRHRLRRDRMDRAAIDPARRARCPTPRRD